MTPQMIDVFFDERVLKHDTGAGVWEAGPSALLAQQEQHPENSMRISNMKNMLETGPISPHLRWRQGEYSVTTEQLTRIHDPEYVSFIKNLCAEGGGRLTSTTLVSGDSWVPLIAAAGTCLAAAKAVIDGTANHAFALVRPPGHHAQPDQADGYCIFCHTALAAQLARDKGFPRVAIIDWDVHHGNGTQECFYDRADVLTISIHMDHRAWGPSHQQTGTPEETGHSEGLGYNVNINLPLGSGNNAYHEAFEHIINPILRQFQPDFIIGACGEDASMFDPCGRQNVDMNGFYEIGKHFSALAAQHTENRSLILQEGGYASAYAAFCLHAFFEGHLGLDRSLDDPLAYIPDPVNHADDALAHVQKTLTPYWHF